ncbi:hypothetical protein AJ78_05301 [Emergomyces pasteurianus Ep9510]|uniref:Spindle pole body component n=1 Tax=Emergomyces pasteurianus Ep9510 TaxID=1447872 RepID=A0A1J9PCQ5_9EURO|nr:hypothetical protein AJ78_05301 [Emergomyces pasteurianus Ep9510]
MLHEILIALSGHHSPLFDQEERGSSAKNSVPLLSPAEHALLQPIAELCRLHTLLRKHTLRISSSHNSTICRAVSTNISTEQLGKFQKHILEVETAVLANDARYVGGRGIVPLSTIRSEFLPWVGRLQWLWQIARFMSPIVGEEQRTCTGASLLDHLRKESHTGYLDLEVMALQLINAGETAFMRQLSMFVLYGQLPSFGGRDFFIQEDQSTAYEKQKKIATDFIIRPELMPSFMSSSTANSILFIGKSLNHIRAQGKFSAGDESVASLSKLTLRGDYLDYLSALSSPISPVALSGAVSKIRTSLSQTALSQLLPLPKIVEILSLLHDFLLLGRGEFAMGLVTFADDLSKGRHRRANPLRSGKSGSYLLDSLTVKEGEVTAVLSQTWSELYSLQNEEDSVDDELDLAREILRLSIKDKADNRHASAKEVPVTSPLINVSDVPFDDVLFGTPTTLSLDVQPPLDLFLSQADMGLYSKIHSYLLAIRRGQIHLSNLWKLSSLRRTHPAPPLASNRGGQAKCQSNRERALTRAVALRPVWITASRALFVLSELIGYMHGEVISNSWQHLNQWLDEVRPSSSRGSRPGTAFSSASRSETATAAFHLSNQGDPQAPKENAPLQHDPETITAAHRAHLVSIIQSLFLTDVPFTRTLRSLLTTIDHLIAMIIRLETVQQNLDLETDEGVVDSLADYAAEDKRIMHDLRLARVEVDKGVANLISRLRDIDDNRHGDGKRPFDLGQAVGNMSGDGTVFGEGASAYVPWKPAGVDQLLMKLDFFSSNQKFDMGGFEFGATLP